MTRGLLTAAVAAVFAAGCSQAGGGGAPATSATGSGTATSANPLVGTWQTDALPPAAWMTAYRAEGATEAQLAEYGEQFEGSSEPLRIIVKVTASRWVEFEQHGEAPPSHGWGGDYQLSDNTVRAVETDSPASCRMVYRVTADGDQLRIQVVSDEPADAPGCGHDDLVIQRAMYETAAFHRVE
jgi:hypothetical protein